MDRASANAFVYAKASGMLKKSFVGPRTEKIFEQQKLSELWTLLFEDEVPLIPEVLLAKEIENKAENQFIKDFCKLLNCYSKPDKVSLFLLKSFDYGNLREIVFALSNGETKLPKLVDIGKYSELKIKNWPDLEKITEKSKLIEDLGADSLDVVELIMAFEDEFGISLPDEDIAKMKTVEDVVKFVSSLK